MNIVHASKEFTSSYNLKKLSVLFLLAFTLRALVFYTYTQHEMRYQQPDTMDYHNSTICMYIGNGMTRPDNGQPIFWRTPGYSAYLLPFYAWFKPRSGTFQGNENGIKAALWAQVFLSSFTPVLLFFLALVLTGVLGLSWLVGFIFAVHPGFVLASGFLLTEALSVLFFFIFLIFFYRGYRMWGEGVDTQTYLDLVIAALSLGIYTWMRPMGQFVGLIALLILVLSSSSLLYKSKKCAVFILILLSILAPWIVRNYRWTGHAFFWPGSGTYLACFNVPKLKRHLTGKSLKECWQETMHEMSIEIRKAQRQLSLEKPGYFVSQELVSGKHMWPWIFAHPWLAFRDWMQEVCKTTFDLYSYQLVSLYAGTFKADPMEEFLTEKMAACLYAHPLPWYTRAIVWIEFFWSIFLWIGLWLGFFFFLVQSIWRKLAVTDYLKKMFFLWIKTGLLIGAVLCMTGGFGYARLRMPVEPLMVILSLTWWYYLFFIVRKNISKK
ncbi:MAG: hypothetical protein AB7F19_04195 [Candidatus Babeliales bacterium]